MTARRARHRLVHLAVATALAVPLAACADDATEPTPTLAESPTAATTPASTPSVPSPTAPSGTTSPSDGALSRGGTGPVRLPGTGGGISLLTAVRLAAHDDHDRFVLELDGPDAPDVRVRYVRPPIEQDGSGNLVDVRGKAFLQVRLTPASGFDLESGEGDATYTGPARVRGDTRAVTEAVRTGDFEAVLTWVLGVDERRPFTVTTASGPSRVIVDVANR